MIRRPPRSTQSRSSAASDVYKRRGFLGRGAGRPSYQQVLVGAQGPGRETLAGLTIVDEVAHHTLHVHRQLVLGGLETPDFAAEAGVQAQRAAEVHLEAADLVSVGVGDQLTLQPD